MWRLLRFQAHSDNADRDGERIDDLHKSLSIRNRLIAGLAVKFDAELEPQWMKEASDEEWQVKVAEVAANIEKRVQQLKNEGGND